MPSNICCFSSFFGDTVHSFLGSVRARMWREISGHNSMVVIVVIVVACMVHCMMGNGESVARASSSNIDRTGPYHVVRYVQIQKSYPKRGIHDMVLVEERFLMASYVWRDDSKRNTIQGNLFWLL